MAAERPAVARPVIRGTAPRGGPFPQEAFDRVLEGALDLVAQSLPECDLFAAITLPDGELLLARSRPAQGGPPAIDISRCAATLAIQRAFEGTVRVHVQDEDSLRLMHALSGTVNHVVRSGGSVPLGAVGGGRGFLAAHATGDTGFPSHGIHVLRAAALVTEVQLEHLLDPSGPCLLYTSDAADE